MLTDYVCVAELRFQFQYDDVLYTEYRVYSVQVRDENHLELSYQDNWDMWGERVTLCNVTFHHSADVQNILQFLQNIALQHARSEVGVGLKVVEYVV